MAASKGTSMTTSADLPTTVTIREAADLTGLTVKALRLRVEREQLRSVLKDGRRRIPVSELVRHGLLKEGGSAGTSKEPQVMPQLDIMVLLDRLEAQAGQLAEHRLITQQSEAVTGEARAELDRARLELANREAEVSALQVRLAEAEATAEALRARRSWFGLVKR